MERDCFYNELKYVRDYACKAAGLDSEIAGWKTAVDAMTKQLADAQEQVGSYKLVNDMHLKTVDKLSRQVEALQAIIKQMGEQACVLAKDGMAAKAQVEALRRERDHAKNMAAVQKEVADNQTWHVRELTAALDAEREKVKDSETAYKKLAEQWSSARASWGKIKK